MLSFYKNIYFFNFHSFYKKHRDFQTDFETASYLIV